MKRERVFIEGSGTCTVYTNSPLHAWTRSPRIKDRREFCNFEVACFRRGFEILRGEKFRRDSKLLRNSWLEKEQDFDKREIKNFKRKLKESVPSNFVSFETTRTNIPRDEIENEKGRVVVRRRRDDFRKA